MNRIFFFIVLFFWGICANAESVQINGIYYNLDDNAKVAEVIRNPNLYSGEISIPAQVSYGGYSYVVTSIGAYAFERCRDLTSLTIPNSVISIDAAAFVECSGLTSLVIPNSVTYISDYVFSGCRSLISLTIPNSVLSIGEGSFEYCNRLTSVTIETTTPIAINEDCFTNRANATLYVPAGCKAAYQAADYWKEFKEIVEIAPSPIITFADAKVKSICSAYWDTNGDGELSIEELSAVTAIGTRFQDTSIEFFEEFRYFTKLSSIPINAFSNCKMLKTISLPENIISIGNYAFNNCNALTGSLIIPNSVEYIGDYAYKGCWNLSGSLFLPNSLTHIGLGAFKECGGISYVSIPSKVTFIGNDAFIGCNSLNSIKVDIAIPLDINGKEFSNYSTTTLYVPNGSKTAYQSTNYWKDFKEIIELDNCNTYTLSIATLGNGNVDVSGNLIHETTKSFTVNEGTSALLTFTSNNGYRIKSVVVNGTDVTSSVTNNQYTISNINQDITVVVTFEAIPTTLTLSATSLSLTSSETGNKSITATVSPTNATVMAESSDTNICTVSVSGTGATRTITVTPKENTGTSQRTATITVTAMANGQSATKTISVTQAGVPGSAPVITAFSIHDVTSTSFSYSMTFTANPATTEYGVCYSSTNTIPTNADNRNSWTEHISGSTVSSTVNNLTPGTTYYIRAYATNSYGTTYSSNVQTVTIPPTTYTLTIQSSGSGTVNCLGYTVSGGTKNIPISESSSATLTITPNDGNRIKSVLVNGTDVTPNVTNNQCAITISNISQNTTVIVTFEAIPTTLTLSATSLSLTSSETNERTITATVSPTTAIITAESSDTNICTVSVSGTGATRTITITPKENTGTSQRTSTITVTATANGQTATKTILVTQAGVPGSAPEITAFNVYDVTGASFYFSMTFTANPAATEYGVCYSTTNTIPNSTTFRFRWTSPSTGITTSSYVTDNLTPGATYYVCAYATNSYGTTYSNVQTVTIPPTNYTLSITSIGNGYVSYSGYTINETAKSYAVSEGSSATLTFTPNDGYRIKSVLVNGTDVISGVTNNQYTISNINQDVSVVVTFEAIPTTLTLSATSLSLTSSETNNRTITATVSPTNATVTAASSNTNICTVSVSGTGATRTITITPKENMGISQRTATITVTATANGETATKTVSVTQAGVPGSAPVITAFNVYDVTRTSFYFSMTFTANPAATTYGIYYSTTNSVPNSTTYWSSWNSPSTGRTASSYVTDNIVPGTTYYVRAYAANIYGYTYSTDIKIVTIPPALTGMTVDGVNYKVNSYNGKTVNVTTGDYGRVLNVPAAFGYEGDTWTVTGIESGALTNATDLAAVIWNPSMAFTERVNNPNLLLYVTSASYAPSSAKNVIVNNVAQTITLTETSSGNDFYCPRSFTARTISYSHRYQMTTGIDDCQGWETIALPFDVQTISHESKGGVAPFAVRTSSQKGFWLYELTSSGWKVASAIKANTPYIISMPNNELYFDAARLNGRITFSAANVSVPMTRENTVSYRGRTFVPSFMHQARSGGIYALNVKNEWYTTNGTEGSLFVANLRDVSPFEAYMTTTNNSRGWFGIFDDTPTDIRGVEELIDTKRLGIYNLNGQKVKNAEFESVDELKQALPAGVYIINGHKVIVR